MNMPTNGKYMYRGTVISLYRVIYVPDTYIRMLGKIL
jgi:hypothetical protein